MTAFPAAAAGLEALPVGASGDMFVEILSGQDIQPIKAPPGIKLHWIVNEHPRQGSQALVEAVKNQSLNGDESIFVAGEYSSVGDLRQYFREEKSYPKEQLYISSYWKRGLIESEHKQVKTLVS